MTVDVFGPAGRWPELGDARFGVLLRHWAGKRHGLLTPRSAIDPIALKSCLPNVWLYQYLPEEDDFRCTLAGEAVNQAWGMSVIGRKPGEFMPRDVHQTVLETYRQTLRFPPLQVSRRRISRADAVEQSAERLILPLSDDTGRASGIIGMTLYYLASQQRIGNPQDMEGAVTFYRCDGLPAGTPP